MGTHGKTGWDRLRLGSVAESTLRQAPCPVLSVRASVTSRVFVNPRRLSISRLLVITDFSASSKAALSAAAVLAKRLNGRLHINHPRNRSTAVTGTDGFPHTGSRFMPRAMGASPLIASQPRNPGLIHEIAVLFHLFYGMYVAPNRPFS
jgi:nucleotide-binding universal stress UspA family protein